MPTHCCRTVTILTWEIGVTFTGVCFPPILLPPKMSCWPRSLSFLRKLTSLNRPCWMNSSATFPVSLPSTTNLRMHSSRDVPDLLSGEYYPSLSLSEYIGAIFRRVEFIFLISITHLQVTLQEDAKRHLCLDNLLSANKFNNNNNNIESLKLVLLFGTHIFYLKNSRCCDRSTTGNSCYYCNTYSHTCFRGDSRCWLFDWWPVGHGHQPPTLPTILSQPADDTRSSIQRSGSSRWRTRQPGRLFFVELSTLGLLIARINLIILLRLFITFANIIFAFG